MRPQLEPQNLFPQYSISIKSLHRYQVSFPLCQCSLFYTRNLLCFLSSPSFCSFVITAHQHSNTLTLCLSEHLPVGPRLPPPFPPLPYPPPSSSPWSCRGLWGVLRGQAVSPSLGAPSGCSKPPVQTGCRACANGPRRLHIMGIPIRQEREGVKLKSKAGCTKNNYIQVRCSDQVWKPCRRTVFPLVRTLSVAGPPWGPS